MLVTLYGILTPTKWLPLLARVVNIVQSQELPVSIHTLLSLKKNIYIYLFAGIIDVIYFSN
jgi:hypothetical protein